MSTNTSALSPSGHTVGLCFPAHLKIVTSLEQKLSELMWLLSRDSFAPARVPGRSCFSSLGSGGARPSALPDRCAHEWEINCCCFRPLRFQVTVCYSITQPFLEDWFSCSPALLKWSLGILWPLALIPHCRPRDGHFTSDQRSAYRFFLKDLNSKKHRDDWHFMVEALLRGQEGWSGLWAMQGQGWKKKKAKQTFTGREWQMEGLGERKEVPNSPDFDFPVFLYRASCSLLPVFSFCASL